VRDGDIMKSINNKPEFEKPDNLQHAIKAREGGKGKIKLYPFLNPGAL